MKSVIIQLMLLLLMLTNQSWASDPRYFGHMLPSPFTMSQGTLAYGTHLGYGVTDHVQMGTSLGAMLSEVPNAYIKFGLWDNQIQAVGVSAEWSKYSLRNSQKIKLASVNSYGLTPSFSFKVSSKVALAFGGTYVYRDITGLENGTETSGYVEGSVVRAEVAWAHGRTVGIAGGVSYDLTYSLFGVGISHHWRNFKLGIHYYPGADRDQFVPMLAASSSMAF